MRRGNYTDRTVKLQITTSPSRPSVTLASVATVCRSADIACSLLTELSRPVGDPIRCRGASYWLIERPIVRRRDRQRGGDLSSPRRAGSAAARRRFPPRSAPSPRRARRGPRKASPMDRGSSRGPTRRCRKLRTRFLTLLSSFSRSRAADPVNSILQAMARDQFLSGNEPFASRARVN